MDLGGTTIWRCFLVESSQGERVHALLKAQGWLEPEANRCGPMKDRSAFRWSDPVEPPLRASGQESQRPRTLPWPSRPPSGRPSTHTTLNVATEGWLTATGMEAHLADVVPTKWERLGDLALLARPNLLVDNRA